MLPDFPKSPLTEFRQNATFDWRKLKIFLEGEECIEFTQRVSKCLEADPTFKREWTTLTKHQAKELMQKQWTRVVDYDFLGLRNTETLDLRKLHYFMNALELYDGGLVTRYTLGSIGIAYILMSQGTGKHKPIIEGLLKHKIVGCLCLTEMSHGSDTKAFQTRATLENGELVFETPNKESMKCWSAMLGTSATHALVFAQLYVKDVCHGLHSFIIQIRDLSTFKPLPGIIIGSVGELVGAWNGVGTGWMMFKGFRAPVNALLDRNCSLTSNGDYKSNFKNPNLQHAATLSALAFSRIGVLYKAAQGCQAAAVIAIRYSYIRRQFGPSDQEELPVINFPLQKHRLFPILANGYVIAMFHRKFNDIFLDYTTRMSMGEKSAEIVELGREIHVLSVACKAVATWMACRGLSEARLACGGHGYMKSSRLNDLRNDFDPSQTYEGDNYLIIQQAAFFLLAKQKDPRSPLGSVAFLDEKINDFKGFSGDILKDVFHAYKWLIKHLVGETGKVLKTGRSAFEARNDAQVVYIQPMATAFAELTMLQWSCAIALEAPEDLRPVLIKLCKIFGLANLVNHLSTLYIGGYCSGPEFGNTIGDQLAQAENDLTNDAIALCDVIAPSDFVLNSALGASDGRVYERLFEECQKTTNCRPDWWSELVAKLSRSKL